LFKFLKLKKLTSLVIASAMVVGLSTPLNVFAEAGAETVEVQILSTSDLHGRFLPFDYAINAQDTSGSLAQAATIIKELRTANPNTIVVDNGDTIQDNSQSLFLDNSKNPNGVNPMVYAMNEIGYDTWTFGNHEFNYGMEILKNVSSKFNGALLCGNVFDKEGKAIGAPYKIIEKGGVKIGIIGMVTPNITRWDGPNLKDYVVTSPVTETKKAIAELKDKVDAIVAVIHEGENGEYSEPGSGAVEVANECPELSAIILGHAHTAIAGKKINGVHVAEALNAGKQLVKLNIKFKKNSDGKYVISNRETDVVSELKTIAPKGAATVEADSDLTKKLQPYHQIALDDANTVIGKLIGGDLVPADEVKGIPTPQIQPTAMIELINKVQMYYGQQIAPDKKKVDVSAAAAFRGDANIKVGDIKKADTALIYKYDNTLYVLDMTGAQLKKYIEWSAKFFNTYVDGDLTISFDPNIPGYNYDMFYGLTYQVDVSKAPGNRIINVKKADGTPLLDSDVLRVAVNNYRANTQLAKPGTVFNEGDALPVVIAKSEDTMGDAGRIRDIIREYIVNVKGGTVTPELTENWSMIRNSWNSAQRALAVELINKDIIKLGQYNPKAVTYTDVKFASSKKVDVVSFNDFHGTMAEEATGKNPGAAKLAAVIKGYRQTNANTIVVSGGDIYQGSAMSNLLYGEPVTELLKSLGVVASAVGNHEFDWGVNNISKWAKDGNFDFLASNVYDKTTKAPVTWAKPYKIVVMDGLKIGFIGVTTPETAFKTKPEIVANLEFRDPLLAANEWADKLKNGTLPEGKVDVVIALTHLGASQDSKGVITGEAADLAKGVKNVDAIIAAHTHMTVAGNVNNIPIVQGYYNGRTLTKLSIMVDTLENLGKVLKIEPSIDNVSANKAKIVEDPEVKALFDKYNAKVGPILNEVAGISDVELTHDRFADGGTSVLGQWATAVMNQAAGTQIAITNGGGLRVPVPAGNITVGKLYEVMPFDNTLVKMELKGSDIKKVIENGIANDSIGWVQVGGITVYYDKTAPAGSRITAMYLADGSKVEMDKYYSVVTNDFMATGGDKYDFSGARNVVDTGMPIRDALVNALKVMNGKHLVVTKNQPLVAGDAPKAVLPKTGSAVDDNGLVSLGSIIVLLGVALFVIDADKKKKKSAA
jgi:2',3'-cyclic-nucleotide 2'-phosphodiesterase / 3'-nucleotidase / 5'-nucleotidase